MNLSFGQWLATTLASVGMSLSHNWPLLLIGTVVAAATKTFVDRDKISGLMRKHSRWSILVAVAVAILTPLCSCGTMAVVLAMMTSVVPWGPIVAFMVASPLSSPSEFLYTSGFLGVPFAAFQLAASGVLGLAGGLLADRLDKAGYLRGQSRLATVSAMTGVAATEVAVSSPGGPAALSCCGASPVTGCGCGASLAMEAAPPRPSRPKVFFRELMATARIILPYWLGFAVIGYGLINALPTGTIERLMGSQNAWSVPVSALLGLPLYFNAETSIPLIKSLIDAGMSPGGAMAFMVTGPATSLGAVAGALTIARRRVVGLILACILIGALAAGFLFEAGSGTLW